MSQNIFDLIWNSPRYSTFHAFRVFSVYVQINCAYSQFKEQIHSTYSAEMHSERSTLFRVISVYVQNPSTYSQYTNRFNQRILKICTDLYLIIGKCTQIFQIFGMKFKERLLQKTVCKCATGPKTHME